MIYELIIFRILIILLILGGIIALYRSLGASRKRISMIGNETSVEDIDAQISKLKELIKEAEDKIDRGIESAQSSLQIYKDSLELLTNIKNKTKDL